MLDICSKFGYICRLMKIADDTFSNEVRSPFLWQEDKPSLFVGAAGHTRDPRGVVTDLMHAYYIGIFWGAEGTFAIEAGTAVHEIRPGTVCLIDHGTWFQIRVLSDFAEFLYLTVDGEDSARFLAQHDLWQGVFRSGKPPFVTLKKLMQDIPKPDKELAQVSLVSALDLLLLIQTEHKRTAPDKSVLEAEVLIHRHWNTFSFNIDVIHEALGINRSTLSDKFKAETGKPMLEYLHEIRLNHAMHLLKETLLPVSEVACKCGFSDAAYFSRFIRKKTGKSPSALRSDPEKTG